MPSLIQKYAHMKGQRSNHHIFNFQPNPSWAKKRPNRYTSFRFLNSLTLNFQLIVITTARIPCLPIHTLGNQCAKYKASTTKYVRYIGLTSDTTRIKLSLPLTQISYWQLL